MPIMPRSFFFQPTAALIMSLSVLVSAVSISPVKAADISSDPTTEASIDDKSTPDHHMNDHSKMPAGVQGGNVVSTGKFAFSYTPMFMRMEDNYIGSSTVSPQTIATTIPSQVTMTGAMGPMKEMYRIVPTTMDVQSHMFTLMYGVTDNFNLMAMASYLRKSMNMTTFSGASGTTVLGSSSATTEGVGDTIIGSLWQVYKDHSYEVILNLGLSLPTGSATQNIAMLSPMNKLMTMRASYGMQLGTGTYDLMPGLTVTSHTNNWSWGTAWRSRFPLGNNSEGYRYGNINELTAWGGYSSSPGITATIRIAESIQGRIRGSDPMISGLMEGTNPNFYGGNHTDLLGGVEIAGGPFGYKKQHAAFEVGKTITQNLNGPQLGHSWTFNALLGTEF
jgi:hypothetical protein